MTNLELTDTAKKKSRSLKVGMLARVEGEGGLSVKIRNGIVQDVKLKIFEPPRFFEALLRGRLYSEAPDITARICGICPVAYQMSAVHALESIFGVTVGGQLRALRRLLYCGEWIESHALHIYMLHAPDFLGVDSVINIAKDHPDLVRKALQLKKVGNDIMNVVGGREIHPINVRVGGFYRLPTKAEFALLLERVKWARDAAYETVRWVSTLEFPVFEQDCEYVALHHPEEYAINEGRVVSNRGLDIPVNEFDQRFTEEHVAHSNALRGVLDGSKLYAVGPLARYNLNYKQFSPLTHEAIREVGFGAECRNPFQSIIVRALETLYACDEAVRIIEAYEPPDRPAVPFEPKAGVGHACTEAPRGILYHRYRIDADGLIAEARISPPTSQNQKMIERDLHNIVAQMIDKSDEEITLRCEHAIRNYDPCISCATHFLKSDITRLTT
ncbi:MAG: Ni/Fe hydrogenase subunit alpha [Anaerolineae bacterium]|nr:Ni/Fe hydrogenase subunit alpha [Chloroflexota bacterium]MBP6297983.1 Ni/Fe hydrogenase subunit alpha [Anaerolineae bacterium]